MTMKRNHTGRIVVPVLAALLIGCSSNEAAAPAWQTNQTSESEDVSKGLEDFEHDEDVAQGIEDFEHDGDVSQGLEGQDVGQGILAPDGDPAFEDFEWYANDVYNNGVPKGATNLSPGYLSGSWKYELVFNSGENVAEVGIADFELTGTSATLVLHPRLIRYENEIYPETDEEVGYEPFKGTFDDELLEVSASGVYITISCVYTYDGKDYAIGFLLVKESGAFADILFVRP